MGSGCTVKICVLVANRKNYSSKLSTLFLFYFIFIYLFIFLTDQSFSSTMPFLLSFCLFVIQVFFLNSMASVCHKQI